MKLNEKKGNLFELDNKYYLAHCISADYALGAGIAVEFNKKFGIRLKLGKIGSGRFPDCILVGRTLNLVTKNKYWNKPTYDSLKGSLLLMKKIIDNKEIKYLGIPKLGCGLDRLQWGKVREIIEEVFKDTDIEIEVRYL